LIFFIQPCHAANTTIFSEFWGSDQMYAPMNVFDSNRATCLGDDPAIGFLIGYDFGATVTVQCRLLFQAEKTNPRGRVQVGGEFCSVSAIPDCMMALTNVIFALQVRHVGHCVASHHSRHACTNCNVPVQFGQTKLESSGCSEYNYFEPDTRRPDCCCCWANGSHTARP
jgi:hypothetical protein